MKRVCLYITDEQYIALKDKADERAKASEHVRRALDLYIETKKVKDEYENAVHEQGSFSNPGDKPEQDRPA